MKSLNPLLLGLLIACVMMVPAFAEGAGTAGSHPQVAVDADGNVVVVFVRQEGNRSVIARAPIDNGSITEPVDLADIGYIRFADLVLAGNSSARILGVATLPRMMTRQGYTAAERDQALQPVVSCFEVRPKSRLVADDPKKYLFGPIRSSSMLDLQCASRSCALWDDGNGSIIIIDSSGYLVGSDSGKFWKIGDNPARAFVADAVAVTIVRAGGTYHIFYATAGADGTLTIHHLTSDDLKTWKDASAPGAKLEDGSRLSVVVNGDQVSLIGTREVEGGGREVVVTTLGGDGTWSEPAAVASGDGITPRIDAVCGADGRIHIVYEETGPDGKPVIRYVTHPK